MWRWPDRKGSSSQRISARVARRSSRVEPDAKETILIVGTQGQRVTSGPGTFMRYVIEAIDRGELDAEVLYPHDSRSTPYAGRSFVHGLSVGSLFHHRFYGSWVLSSLALFWVLRALNRHRHYSRIWFADRYTALFCVLSGELRRKTVVMVNDDTRIRSRRAARARPAPRLADWRSWSVQAFYVMERFICRRSLAVVANSEHLARVLREEYGLTETVTRLYKAVDLTRFAQRANEPCSKRGIRVLFVKSEWLRGGLDILLEALTFAGLEEVSLRVVGGGQPGEAQRIRRLVSELGLEERVAFEGLIGREEMPLVFREVDVFCVPARSEALGVASLEALASGTPVVASNVGGIPEVLDGGRAGWMVPPEDPATLSAALSQSIVDSDLRRAKQRHGLRHVAKFSCEAMIDGIRDISRR